MSWTVAPADTGAGTALSRLSGRTVLQITNDIPNYAASATASPASAGELFLVSACKPLMKTKQVNAMTSADEVVTQATL